MNKAYLQMLFLFGLIDIIVSVVLNYIYNINELRLIIFGLIVMTTSHIANRSDLGNTVMN